VAAHHSILFLYYKLIKLFQAQTYTENVLIIKYILVIFKHSNFFHQNSLIILKLQFSKFEFYLFFSSDSVLVQFFYFYFKSLFFRIYFIFYEYFILLIYVFECQYLAGNSHFFSKKLKICITKVVQYKKK